MMERLKEKDDLNIYQFVTEMRSKRTFMVQTMVSGCKCIVDVCEWGGGGVGVWRGGGGGVFIPHVK